eukprot:scaffold2930_cov105-Isochrysis_galbana.AAC.10
MNSHLHSIASAARSPASPVGACSAHAAHPPAVSQPRVLGAHHLLHAVCLQLGACGDPVAQTAAKGAALGELVGAVVGGEGVLERGQHGRDALLGLDEQVLQVEQHRVLARLVDESGGHTRLAAPARPADPVHVVLDLLWHVEVDNVLDVGEVEALGGHVGPDEHVLLAGPVGVDGELPLVLVLAAVNAHL